MRTWCHLRTYGQNRRRQHLRICSVKWKMKLSALTGHSKKMKQCISSINRNILKGRAGRQSLEGWMTIEPSWWTSLKKNFYLCAIAGEKYHATTDRQERSIGRKNINTLYMEKLLQKGEANCDMALQTCWQWKPDHHAQLPYRSNDELDSNADPF